jgi:hypothetical protein
MIGDTDRTIPKFGSQSWGDALIGHPLLLLSLSHVASFPAWTPRCFRVVTVRSGRLAGPAVENRLGDVEALLSTSYRDRTRPVPGQGD